MREEDLDWAIYHRIPATGCVTVEDLAAATGFEQSAVTASLDRLERYLLVRRSDDEVRLLSIQESLIECQCRHTTEDLPFVIENGVIRAKKRDE
ncbi:MULTISPECIES: MarR family transcriptional regulator [unclassified Methanoculleus]|uniref:MarR family transcriptional regulator n=1 Tax=unclassified Methanoculleus TaxID=2619537 RepID=UPI0025DDFFF6|nr:MULTISPECIES: MarR family transcriptional regulator [unclassified Methanoculleus]MCK9318479.1 MarR family transcriptional regulator [Methanoculleus sp.]MDD2254343.1 MarR family transcriptional regulator [Methanoculleus sp.]MDD2788003.1 MarR family transcriptional regulator [Methanoculleus sp.]MDD3216722.1 MarR family transcriptional regulator [Methanoculleus sp.]MDD4313597.1 MarR family transcriptional regulator [Methanoculleus sp.]